MKGPGTSPPLWPHFSSPLRSTALTARLGAVLGICLAVCFGTGLLSHYQYQPWTWLPEPAAPIWIYRVTQGVHVATGIATIPLLLVKLWSVYPNLFRWPAVRSLPHALERGSVAVLVATALLQLFTGFFNVLNWYPWPWSFVPVHRFLAYVLIGSLLLHIAVKLPDITYGLKTRLVDGDVLTEKPWNENPASYSNNDKMHQPPPSTPAISRRGLLVAASGGIGLVALTSVGQTLTPLEPIGLLAVRQPSTGPQGVPVNRTADQAGVRDLAADPNWQLIVSGPDGYQLSLADIEAMAAAEADLPITCVEGWSVGAHWTGIRLLDVVRRAGGNAGSRVDFVSLEPRGSFNHSTVQGPQLSRALLATHLNGQRLDVDHGYPLRLIAPDRAGVLNTKWLKAVTVR
ncbi:Oxidoreductase molybdopterin binding domain-containing protein [Modestobacter sp. DSM 44400]|nr:Oxidoreductase molybdopterin binding domain-containing protein [Modestobacter sp. DSM 44400]